VTPPNIEAWPHLFRPGSEPAIITLHGFGGNENEASAIATWLPSASLVLSPRGPKHQDGADYWYGALDENGFNPVDLEEQAHALMDFLEQAALHYRFNLHDAVLTGFSNGAAMALGMAALFPDRIHSVAAFSGTMPFREPPSGDLSQTSIWFSHGDRDGWVPPVASDFATETLTSLGARLGFLTRSGGHEITPEEIEGARNFLLNPAAKKPSA